MRNRHIDEDEPAGSKPDKGREPHAVGNRARDQCHCDDGKGHLIEHEQHFRDGRRKRARRFHAARTHERALKRAEPRPLAGETQAVANCKPQEGAQSGANEALRHRGEHVLLAHHSAIEQGKARDGHHQN